jgi:hypothetical protein
MAAAETDGGRIGGHNLALGRVRLLANSPPPARGMTPALIRVVAALQSWAPRPQTRCRHEL